MSTSWLIHTLLGGLLLPPLNLLLLAAIGLFMRKRRRRVGSALVAGSLVLLAILSMPWVGDRLEATWQTPYLPLRADQADAIVVLGGGVYEAAPEYGGDTVNAVELERLRYAAQLYRRFGKPILVAGGAPSGGPPEAPLMKATLEREFGVPVRWVDATSNDTEENAGNAAAILKPYGIRRVFVVSQAWHLPRALVWFRLAGLEPVPAGTGFAGTGKRLTPDAFIPSGRGLQSSYIAFHEAVGMLWYRIRH
jgi:uncharacterized SAM-binding protein YcdF (DUF218 family)